MIRALVDGDIYLSAPWGGGFNYLNELLPRLAKFPEVQVRVLTPHKVATDPPKSEGVVVQKAVLPSARWFPEGRMKRVLSRVRRGAEKGIWHLRLAGLRNALYHSTFYQPAISPYLPVVLTVYDMITELYRDEFTTPAHELLRTRKEAAIRASTHFIAISAQTKADLCRIYGIAPERVTVAHLGINRELFARPPAPGEAEAVKVKFSLPERYVLYVGGRLHHKNFPRFAEAYAASALKKDHLLVATGGDWDPRETALLDQLGIRDRARLARLPSDAELRLLYRFASLFVYPSIYEGFGMPLLEAMASGTPVATARASCLPEIAGEAARYFDPKDPSDMAAAMDALTDPATAERYRRAGLERVNGFSWDNTAEQTVSAYRKTLSA